MTTTETETEASPKTKKVPVVEVFGPTIQGEGAMIGVRTAFIRFGLCDYKCTMCDSMHAVDPKQVRQNASWLAPEEILRELAPIVVDPNSGVERCEWVTLSGGNPCIHDLTTLVLILRGAGLKIAVETQGTFRPSWLSLCDVITVSPKSPGMGELFEEDKFLAFVEEFQHYRGFNVKVVVFNAYDLEWARTINDIMIAHDCGDRMYLSLGNPYPPQHPNLDMLVGGDSELKLQLLNNYKQITEDLLQIEDMKNVKFLPQLHVLTWANLQKV